MILQIDTSFLSSKSTHRFLTFYFTMKIVVTLVSALVNAALGVSMHSVLHESRESHGMIKTGSLPADEIIPVRIAVKQVNLDKGMDLLMDV